MAGREGRWDEDDGSCWSFGQSGSDGVKHDSVMAKVKPGTGVAEFQVGGPPW